MVERKAQLSIDDSPEESSVHSKKSHPDIVDAGMDDEDDDEQDGRVAIYDWEDPDEVEQREALKLAKKQKMLADELAKSTNLKPGDPRLLENVAK